MSPASAFAVESTPSRRELFEGSASSEENESKNLVISLPMSPAVEVDEPESGVKSAWTVLSAVSREPEAEANCCC